MKNLLFLVLFLFFFQASYCDVVPENTHYYRKCVKIINIDEFPDYSFIGYIKQVSGDHSTESYIINSKDCIHKGYKFNMFYIVAAKKSYLLNKNLDNLNWLEDKNVLKANISIGSEGGYTDNDDPMSFLEEHYKIVKLTKTRIILYKSTELLEYSNGEPFSVKEYAYEEQSKSDVYPFKNDDRVIEIYPNTKIFHFLLAFLVTIFIETLILFLLFKTRYKKLNITNKLLLITGFITSFSTLPYVWFVFPAFITSRFPYIAFSECFAILIESVIIYKLLKIDYKKALLVSIICNVISFSIGLLINWNNVYDIIVNFINS